MTDFVAELRPRLRPQAVFEHPEGFVAEFRPRRMNTIPEESDDACHKSFIVPCPTDDACCKSYVGPFCKEDATRANSDYSDSDLLNALSEKKFSKESITHLLENSIITLVEKLLINRPIHRIRGNIRVLLNDDDSPIILDLNKQFTKFPNGNYDYLTELDSGFNVKLRDELVRESEGRLRSECRTGDVHGAECMQVSAVSPPLDAGFRDDDARPVCSPPSGPDSPSHQAAVADSKTTEHHREAKKRRRDSDDESGYTSKDDLDCNVEEHAEKSNSKRPEVSNQHRVFNEYFCNGFDGSETLYNPENGRLRDNASDSDRRSGSSAEGSDEMEDDLVHESRLVIDENPTRALEAFPSMDTSEGSNAVKSNHNIRLQEGLKIFECLKSKTSHELSSESEEFESLISSDITDVDTDAPVDLSGDSALSRSMSEVLPHPQSLVTKHPDGLKCKQCSLIIADGKAVSEHALNNHNLFSCSFCYRTFTAKNNLKRHVRLHTGSRPYKCAQCPQTFARRDDLKGHVLRHDYSKPFRCSICNKGYTDRACVKNHMAKEHRSRLMHVCPSCGESFDRDESFTQHKKSHPELQQFSCRKCSFIGTNNLMTLKHNLLHTHKLFSCKLCNAYFSDPFDYTTHVRKHKKLASFTQYTCCFCNFSLSTYDQYVRHEYSHAQGKSHSCKVCKKQFKNKSLLNEHCQSHQETQASSISNESEKASISSEKATVPAPPEAAARARPVPDTPQIIAEEADYDEYHGQLLDLSMKKPSSPDFGGSFESRQRVKGIMYDVPRNGYVIKPFTQRSEAQAATPYKPASAVEEKTYRPVFNVRHENILTPGTKDDLRFPQKTSPLASDKQSCSDKSAPSERLTLNHGYPSNVGNRGALRFAPYHAQKMLEFANKYIATRGPKISSKVAMNLTPESPEAILPMLTARKDSGVQNAYRASADDWRQSGNDLSADPSGALPTVIKSELPSDSDMEEASNGPHAPCGSPSQYHPADAHIPFDVHGETEKSHHTCDLCKDSFRSFNDLEAHSVDIHKRYLCEHCMKTFTTRPNRDRHARVHTGERPYKCDLCDLAFFRGDDLKYHRTTRHPSAQPYVCPRCSVSFTWGRDLERHIRHSKCKA